MLRTIKIQGDTWLQRDFELSPDNATIPLFTRHPIPSKTGGQFGAMLPDTVVLHYTGGATAEGAIAHWKLPATKASAHFVVDVDGSVTQCVPLNRIAWHAGESQWRSWTGEMRYRLNHYSIGIELVNPGALTCIRAASPDTHFLTWWGKRWPNEEACLAKGDWWATYPVAQLTALYALVDILGRVMPDAAGAKIREIVGHDQIAPGRKSDPGGAFPWNEMRKHFPTEQDNLEASEKPVQGTGASPASTGPRWLQAALCALSRLLAWLRRGRRAQESRQDAQTEAPGRGIGIWNRKTPRIGSQELRKDPDG